MFYNIGLFIRFIVMHLIGAQGAWLRLNGGPYTRWKTDSTSWTTHIPTVFKNDGDYWFSRWELFTKKHMKSNFQTFREKSKE